VPSWTTNQVILSLENVASPAAGQRVISCVYKTIQAVDKEREILVRPRCRHFGHWHNTDTVTLQTTQHSLTSADIKHPFSTLTWQNILNDLHTSYVNVNVKSEFI